jgi:hypothetical protein
VAREGVAEVVKVQVGHSPAASDALRGI